MRSKIATARSCSTSGLRCTTRCSSSETFITRMREPSGESLIAASADGSAPPLEAPGHRAGMGLEALFPGQGDGGRPDAGEAGGIAGDDRAALQEIEHAEAGGEARAACRRQDVVGSGHVIAERLRRVAPEEDRA